MAMLSPDHPTLLGHRCPVCRESPSKPVVIHKEGWIVTATFLCANTHHWVTKWRERGGEAA